jgi:hypothetical protein
MEEEEDAVLSSRIRLVEGHQLILDGALGASVVTCGSLQRCLEDERFDL